MHFHLGQKVVCINDRLRPGQRWGNGHETSVKAGVIYTIREIVPREPGGYREPGLRLVEIVNRLDEYTTPTGRAWLEAFFRVSRFFPVRPPTSTCFWRCRPGCVSRGGRTWRPKRWVEAFQKAIEAGEIGNGQ